MLARAPPKALGPHPSAASTGNTHSGEMQVQGASSRGGCVRTENKAEGTSQSRPLASSRGCWSENIGTGCTVDPDKRACQFFPAIYPVPPNRMQLFKLTPLYPHRPKRPDHPKVVAVHARALGSRNVDPSKQGSGAVHVLLGRCSPCWPRGHSINDIPVSPALTHWRRATTIEHPPLWYVF